MIKWKFIIGILLIIIALALWGGDAHYLFNIYSSIPPNEPVVVIPVFSFVGVGIFYFGVRILENVFNRR